MSANPDLQALWDYDDPEASEARFRDLLAGDLDPGLAVEAQTQVARAQALQRRFDDARTTLAEAALGTASPRGTIRIALEQGRVARSSGNPDAARPYFEEAWRLATAVAADGLAVDAAHMVAIVATPDEAIEWNERALELAASSTDPDARRWVGSLANNMGWAFHDRGEPEVALGWFDQALAARRAEGDAGRERIARWSVARCLRSLGRLDEALAIQRALAVELDAAGETDGYVFEEIGECLLELGRADEARPWFALAHVELAPDDWLASAEPQRIERLRALAAADA